MFFNIYIHHRLCKTQGSLRSPNHRTASGYQASKYKYVLTTALQTSNHHFSTPHCLFSSRKGVACSCEGLAGHTLASWLIGRNQFLELIEKGTSTCHAEGPHVGPATATKLQLRGTPAKSCRLTSSQKRPAQKRWSLSHFGSSSTLSGGRAPSAASLKGSYTISTSC